MHFTKKKYSMSNKQKMLNFIYHQGAKDIKRYHCTTPEWLKLKTENTTCYQEMWKNWNSHKLLREFQVV